MKTLMRYDKTILAGLLLAAMACCSASAVAQDYPDPKERPERVVEGEAVPQDAYRSEVTPVVESVLFYIFGGALLLSAVGLCICRDVVRMATCLFFTLGSAAVLYLLLGAFFLGAIQLIVYAGGTLILLVFGVMLTNKSPWVRFDCKPAEMIAAAGVAIVLFFGLATMLTTTEWAQSTGEARSTTVAQFGKALLTTYLVPFEVASVMLLVVMIAAAYMARQE